MVLTISNRVYIIKYIVKSSYNIVVSIRWSLVANIHEISLKMWYHCLNKATNKINSYFCYGICKYNIYFVILTRQGNFCLIFYGKYALKPKISMNKIVMHCLYILALLRHFTLPSDIKFVVIQSVHWIVFLRIVMIDFCLKINVIP